VLPSSVRLADINTAASSVGSVGASHGANWLSFWSYCHPDSRSVVPPLDSYSSVFAPGLAGMLRPLLRFVLFFLIAFQIHSRWSRRETLPLLLLSLL
jgi:hypothetical protein